MWTPYSFRVCSLNEFPYEELNLWLFPYCQESKKHVTAREISLNIKKKEEGPYWPRLLKDPKKVSQNEDDVNCGNKNLNEDMIVQVVIAFCKLT